MRPPRSWRQVRHSSSTMLLLVRIIIFPSVFAPLCSRAAALASSARAITTSKHPSHEASVLVLISILSSRSPLFTGRLHLLLVLPNSSSQLLFDLRKFLAPGLLVPFLVYPHSQVLVHLLAHLVRGAPTTPLDRTSPSTEFTSKARRSSRSLLYSAADTAPFFH